MTTPAPARFAGLDGLRAIAVLLVVVYHLFPGASRDDGAGGILPGGFIGVDVFFVLSGFLITSLLLRERDAAGRVSLRGFWTRRARRLLPALALVVTVCASAAWLIGGDVLVGLGPQVLGAATFSYNWVAVAGGGSYFSAAQPEVFRNLWSLAVEEQFYVLWPLLLPLLLLLRGRWLRVLAALALAAGSAGWAASVVQAGDDVTRAYYGTDTHAFGLLLGVALAVGMHGLVTRPSIGGVGPAWGAVVGTAALGGLVVLATTADGDGATTFPWPLVAASVLTAVLVAVAVRPGSWFGRALDVAPLRWIGERSYGIYLWHWPLLVLITYATTGATTDAGVPVSASLLTLALTLVAATISFVVVEQPVRRHGFRGVLVELRGRLVSSPARRFGALTTIVAGALVLGGTTAALAAAPPQTSSEAAVAAGQAALDRATAAEATTAPTATAGAPAATPTAPAKPSAPSSGATPPPATPGVLDPTDPTPGPVRVEALETNSTTDSAADREGPRRPEPAHVDGSRITAVGDSVMLASAGGLLDEYPGIQIDAKVSRSMWAGPGILEKLAERGKLREYVVVALGTNGPVDATVLDEIGDIVGPDRHLVLVNAYAPRTWIPGVNRDLARFAKRHPGVAVADWSRAIAHKTDLLAADRIHPGAAGARVFAQAVASVVDELEGERVEEAYRAAVIQWSLTGVDTTR